VGRKRSALSTDLRRGRLELPFTEAEREGVARRGVARATQHLARGETRDRVAAAEDGERRERVEVGGERGEALAAQGDRMRTFAFESARERLEACAPGGGWTLGSGNSVANYIPVENFLAMLDEGRQWGVY